jgi:ribosomal protein L13
MSEDLAKSEDSESESDLRVAPRLPISLEDSRNMSYVDLIESYYTSRDMEFPSDTGSDSAEHHYPLLLQSINERLEKYGQLAIVTDVAMKSKAPERQLTMPESEDPNLPKKRKMRKFMDADENYYDLSDKFIDDRGLNEDHFSEKEFYESIEDGFYMLKNLKQKHKATRSKTPRKEDEVAVPIRRALAKLKKLYLKKPSNSLNHFPKGALTLLKSIRHLVEKNRVSLTQSSNEALVLANVAAITGRAEEDILKYTDTKFAQEAARKKLTGLKDSYKVLKKSIKHATHAQKPEVSKLAKEYFIRLRAYTDQQLETSKRRARAKNFRAELEALAEEVQDLNPSVFNPTDILAISFEEDVRQVLWPSGFEPLQSTEYDSVE